MAEFTITPDEITRAFIQEWRDHQKSRPDAPPDYLANIDHLRMQMDRWTAHDEALRLIVGNRLAELALREGE